MPDQVTASTIWIDGRAGSGGLAERARQGWNSVTGGGYAPVMLALQVRARDEGGLDQKQRSQARDLLRVC